MVLSVDSSAGVGMIKSVTNTPLTFGVNDSERMRITSGGNVGIGTTTPSEKLTITDGKLFLSTSDPTIGGKIYGYNDTSVNLYSGGLKFQTRYFDGSNYVYADRITINGLGNVGIGTTSPATKFTVEGILATKPAGVDAYYSYLKSNWSADNAFELGISAFGSSFYHKLITSSGYYNGETLQFWTNDTERARFDISGNFGIGTTSPQSKLSIGSNHGTLISIGQPLWSNTAVLKTDWDGSDFTQLLVASNAANSAAITLRASGNVGIGTTSPNFLIHSNGSGANSYMQFTSATTGTTSSDGLIIGTGDAGDAVFLNRENTTMQFYTNNTERMRITSSGNVGINTAAPIHKLSVNGKIGGDVYADSFLEFTATTETIVSADGNVVLGYAQNVVVDNEGSLGVGTISPSTCAIVEIQSTNQGFLPPRMRTGERDNILGTPKPGLMIFNTDDEVIQVYTDGSGWRTLAFL
jgi:hypothetical protein